MTYFCNTTFYHFDKKILCCKNKYTLLKVKLKLYRFKAIFDQKVSISNQRC